MSGASDTPDRPLPDAESSASPMRAFLRLTRGWLTAPDRGNARLLILLLLGLTCLQVYIAMRFNWWNRDFFNALENRDGAAFRHQILVFGILAVSQMSVIVALLYTKQLIQLAWRQWLTGHLLGRWLNEGRQYQMEMAGEGADNPDQRIAEDVRVSVDLAVDFVGGLMTSSLMLVVFVGILWGISGPLTFGLMGREVTIPGYMVWAALLYAGVGTVLTLVVGAPLVRLNIARTTAEADFRFGLVRARESGEGIALIRGETDERRGLKEQFTEVAGRLRDLMRSQRNLMWLTSAYGTLAMIFPTVVASPGYFAGAITLGVLMQIGAAFGEVQRSLSWFVDSFPKLAEWRSAVTRLVTFQDALSNLDALVADPEQPTINVREEEGDRLVFRGLEVAFANGTTVIADAEAEIHAGERVLIKGESGTGKSTLFRAIGGLWPWGAGEIVTPPRAQMMFMPQRPYLPLGSLRVALAYPAGPEAYDDAAMSAALDRVGLGRLSERLDEVERWDRVLSLGEQQRLAFARLLLHRPKWVFMDEATAALDEANQDAMMNLVIEELPEVGLVSIGHRPGLEVFHTRTLQLQRAEGGARLSKPRRQAKPPRRSPLRWLKPRRRDAPEPARA
ncbi:MAG: ABC transporter ATP-binding protein/permease [Acetobacteraceae bacterium]|nr:ABC transporter ATP-binding protein/permease [Acetobacteraceae bacterium]